MIPILRPQTTNVNGYPLHVWQVNGSDVVTLSSSGLTSTEVLGLSGVGHILFDPDNTYDIGASGANRPRNLYMGGHITLANNGMVSVGNSGGTITLGSNGTIQFGSGGILTWSSTTDPTATKDVLLFRDAANSLGQRNGVSAQSSAIYNTYSDTSNYERLRMYWSGNSAWIASEAAGTGTGRSLFLLGGTTQVAIPYSASGGRVTLTQNNAYGAIHLQNTSGATAFTILEGGYLGLNYQINAAMRFGTNSTYRWQISAAGHLLAETDNTYDIGAVGATRPRHLYLGGGIAAIGNIVSSTGYISAYADIRLWDLPYMRVAIPGASAQWAGGYNVEGNATPFTSLRHNATAPATYIMHFNDGSIQFGTATSQTAGTTIGSRWKFDPSGMFTPVTNVVYDVGTAAARVRNVISSDFTSYNAYTDASNYERLHMFWSTNTAYLGTEQLGTGVARSLYLGTFGAANLALISNNIIRWIVDSTGHLVAGADNTYDIGSNSLMCRTVNTKEFWSWNTSSEKGGITWSSNIMRVGTVAARALALVTSDTARIIIPSGGYIQIVDGNSLEFGTTTGTQLGTTSSQKLSFWGATPVDRPTFIADPAGGGTVDAEARTAIAAILDLLIEVGLMAAS